MLPLQTRATIEGSPRQAVLKVVTLREFLRGRHEPAECALWFDASEELVTSRAVEDVEWGAVFSVTTPTWSCTPAASCVVSSPKLPAVVAVGDVIRVNERTGLVSVLFRRGSRNNSLFVTERCNSYCLMCSQPPVDRDDSSRIDELLRLVSLVDADEDTLGITGGEPTLLGSELLRLLEALKIRLPATRLHVLTNGRRFADAAFVQEIRKMDHPGVMWAIPLYSDAPEVHDYVVQRAGAFAETLQGLMNLARESQHIELRVVLQQATVPRIRQLAHFIARNLPFVDHVAWMGLEPMGFARPNWARLWIEPEEYVDALTEATETLHDFRISTSIYNVPLCVLPNHLRPLAAQSISDWKNTYLPECEGCELRARCAGFFASADHRHVPRHIRPIKGTSGASYG
jgi:His-Xaa-Ser system radical SAM maturase HxsC